jgi:hypothetical protein
MQEVKGRKQVKVIDGRHIESGDITYIATVGMKIQGHGEQLPTFITKLEYYPSILRIPCLRKYDVALHFVSNTFTIRSQYCTIHGHDAPVTVQGVTEEPPQPVYQVREIFESQIQPQRPF